LRRAREFNIPCSVYEEARTFENLTLVSIETIVTSSFIRQVQQLITSSKLDRIIVDECHLLITARSYRSIMFRFRELLVLRTQFVFLTGTLPYSFEDELKRSLLLDNLSIIRASSTRLNISYRVRVYKYIDEEQRIFEIKSYIDSFITSEFISIKDKVLVFCPSVQDAELVASILGCSYYTSSLPEDVKRSTLNTFLTCFDDSYRILVSTSALEEGIDYPSIRLVVYKDIAYSFIGFLQGSSRGGRDNQASTSMFFCDSSKLVSPSLGSSSSLDIDKSVIYNYLSEKTCRLRQISLYLDSRVVDECSPTNTLCDLCFHRSSIKNEQVARVLESNREVERYREEVKAYLLDFVSSCILCSLLRSIGEVVDARAHISSECEPYKSILELASTLKINIKSKNLRLSEDSCCFTCLLPTVICAHLKVNSSTCFDSDFMFYVLALFFSKRVPLGLEERFQLDTSISYAAFFRLFLKKVYIEELGTESILAFQALLQD
ncbi:P-loop containing nucleoside triphosphate hydrolase protein, partial [Hyaloscypha variabilis]